MTNPQTGIDGSKLSPWEQIFTFVAPDGYNIHIHAPRLRQHLLATGHPIVVVPVQPKLAQDYVRDNIVSPRRVLQLDGASLWEPIILCKTEAYEKPEHPTIPQVLHVDGHHRLVRHAMMGLSTIKAFLVDMYRWQPFRVYNLPDTTQAQLNAEPIIPRHYWKSKP